MNEDRFYTHQLIENLNDLQDRYNEALNALEALVNHCGVMSPVWKLPREILNRERPILKEEGK